MKRVKRQYPDDFKTGFGFTTICWINGFATMVFSLFMQFLTDYSGIDAAVGKVGFAAAFGTVILLVTRIVDAVDDPLQAWIMDRSKECKFGKYRRYTLISVLLLVVGIIMMFTLPAGVKSNAVLLSIWIMSGYIIYEMGCAFNGTYAMMQKSTTDVRIRTKLSALIRFGIILSLIPSVFFIPIVTAANKTISDMGKSFSVCVVGIALASAVISLIGIALTKEPYHGNAKTEAGNEPKLSIKEVWDMLKHNRPLWVHNIACFVNIAYAVSSAVVVYFLKWFYCADLTTGVVDEAMYAGVYALFGVFAILPNLIAPMLAGVAVKLFGTADRATRGLTLLCAIGYGIMLVCYFTGILQLSPLVYIVLNMLVGIPASVAVVPSMLVNTECADYAEYTTGKNMAAMTTAINSVVSKAQTAIGTVIPGIILMSVGYSVNSTTGAYAGDLAGLPNMIRGLVIAITVVPMIVSILTWAIYKYGYNITPEFRAKMIAELEQRRATIAEDTEQ